MSVDISVSITEDVVDIIATPTVNIVNVTNSASIDPALYDLSEFTNTSPNPFVRTSGLASYVPTSRTLTINGTTQDLSANRTFTISTGLTVGTTPISSGTVGRVLFQGTGNVLQQSANLFWDATNNRLGIGTSTPSDTLSVNGNLTLLNLLGTNRSTQLTTSSSSDNLSSITFYPATGTNVCQSFDIMPRGTGQANQKSQFSIWGTDFIANQTNYELLLTRATGVSYTFESFRGGTGAHRPILFSAGVSNQLWAYTSGNIGINTTTDAGFKLDVNGTARVQGKLTVSTGGIDLTGTLTNFSAYQGYGTMQLFSASAFQMFNTANNSKASFQYTTATGLSLSINPENLSGINTGLGLGASLVASANNQTLVGLDINPTFTNGAFTGVENIPIRNVITSNAAVTKNILLKNIGAGVGTGVSIGFNTNNANNLSHAFIKSFYVTSGLSMSFGTGGGATLNAEGTTALILNDNQTANFTAKVTANSGGFQANGVSANLLMSDNGTPVITRNGSTGIEFLKDSFWQTFSIFTNNSERMRVASTGNVLINTPIDSGYKLDVNGIAMFQGNVSVSLNQNNTTLLSIFNTTAGTLANAALQLVSDASAGQAQVFKYSSTRTAYKTLAANDFGHYNATAGDISFLNDVATGRIKFATGGVSTPQMTLFPTGNLGINTTTDDGFRLDVNGTARVSGLTTLSGTMTASGAIARNQLINGTLVAAANNDVLIGLDVTPTFNLSSFPNITTLGMRLVSATNFSIMRMQNSAGNIDFGVGNSTLYFDSKTFATDFFVNSANRLRIATTGNLLINTTTDAGFRLDVNGTARIDQTLRVNGTGTDTAIQFRAGRIDADSNWIRIKSAGNVDMINIAQNFVGINATVATASAVLQADSTTRGFLPPRMTTTQKNAIASPAAGLMIYDTDLNRPCFYNGTSWITL